MRFHSPQVARRRRGRSRRRTGRIRAVLATTKGSLARRQALVSEYARELEDAVDKKVLDLPLDLAYPVRVRTTWTNPKADDLGYGDISCYGPTGVETPHLDKLASADT